MSVGLNVEKQKVLPLICYFIIEMEMSNVVQKFLLKLQRVQKLKWVLFNEVSRK